MVHWTTGLAQDNFARILWNNLARRKDLEVSSEIVGFLGAAAQVDNTFEFWRSAAAPATWRVDLGEALAVDSLGIAAHDLGSVGATVRAQYSSDDSIWSNASDEATPVDDGEILLLFPSQTARFWRLVVDDMVDDFPNIGVIHLGVSLVMQRGLYVGHSPINLRRETAVRPSVSEGGQWLGRNIVRSGLNGDASWDNLTALWYRQNFDPFVASSLEYPFFFAWRPKTFPAEVAFCQIEGDTAPSNQKAGYVSVGIRMKGAGYI